MDKKMRTLVLLCFVVAVVAQTAVNILAKEAAPSIDPLVLSGTRLFVGAALLAIIGGLAGFRFKPSGATSNERKKTSINYVIVGFLNMALPHALLFIGLRQYARVPLDAALVEAAVPGVVLVYVLSQRDRTHPVSALSAVLAFLGLIVFMKIPWLRSIPSGWAFLMGSALVSSLGLIVDDRIRWPKADNRNTWRFEEHVPRHKVEGSWRKSFFAAGAACILTMLAVPFTADPSTQLLVPIEDWPSIIALAIAGTCLVWLCIFFLISQEQLLLVAVLLCAVPIPTYLYHAFFSEVSSLQWNEWVGALAILVTVPIIVRLEIAKPGDRSEPRQEDSNPLKEPDLEAVHANKH